MTDLTDRLRAATCAGAVYPMMCEAAGEIDRLQKIEEAARDLLSRGGYMHGSDAHSRLGELLDEPACCNYHKDGGDLYAECWHPESEQESERQRRLDELGITEQDIAETMPPDHRD